LYKLVKLNRWDTPTQSKEQKTPPYLKNTGTLC
jgi:hypothetical protein